MNTSNQITLYVMNQKGLAVLKSIISTFGSRALLNVVGARDKNLVEDCNEDIQQYCSNTNIPYFDRSANFTVGEFALAVGWRWLIKNPTNLIIFHDSILPRYRGFSPLVNSLINMEPRIGVTAIKAASDYDTGDIIEQRSIEINYPIKIDAAIALISPLYAEIAVAIVRAIIDKKSLVGVPQDHAMASYSVWRDEDDYLMDWSLDAVALLRFIDAVGSPYKGASSILNGKKVRIRAAKVLIDVKIEARSPGKVLFLRGDRPIVICGKGLLMITDLADDATNKSLLPLTSFRSRFVGKKL